MESFFRASTLENSEDVLCFFQQAIAYREGHKQESDQVARFVFDATHEARLRTPLPQGLERIRYEFGALEAPGQPDDGGDYNMYADQLWDRLRLLIETINNEKRTV